MFQEILMPLVAMQLCVYLSIMLGARPLAHASVRNCQASTNHGSLAQFGEYDFHIQNILFKISVTVYFPL